jgi:predicted dehydrogenase
MDGDDASPLRWGFIGASRIAASALAPAVLAEDGHLLEAIAARSAPRAEAFAARFGIPRAYGDYTALLKDSEIDAVYLSLRNDEHVIWTVAALEAGKHVLCEKPLALNAAEVVRMADAAGANGTVLMEAFCSGFHPQYDMVDALIASGGLGELVGIEARFAAVLDDRSDFRWQAAHGGGALYDIGCYCVAMIRRIAGRFPDRVVARMRVRHGVDASLQALFDFGTFSASITCSFDAGAEQQLTVAGTSGRLTLMRPFSAIGREIEVMRDGAMTRFAPMNPYRAMIAHFREGIVTGRPIRHGVGEIVGQAATLDAIFRAADSNTFEPVAADG